MTERIIVANAYVGNNQPHEAAKWLDSKDARVGIICEIAAIEDELENRGTVAANLRDTPRDVGIVVFGRKPSNYSWRGEKLTDFIDRPNHPENAKLWRDRWYVRVKIFNRVYYSIHANAYIQDNGQWLDHRGAEVWRTALLRLIIMIRMDMEAGFRVRVAGDFNFPASSRVVLSPHWFFNRLNMEYVHDGKVMFFGFDPRKDKLKNFQKLGTVPGADAHDVLLITLTRRLIPRPKAKSLPADLNDPVT